MSPKLGSHYRENPKDKLIQVRADEETLQQLDYVSEKSGLSKSEVVRKGIENQYKELKEKE